MSGGEAVLLGLAAQFLRRPDVLLLDEPTNNLDLDARGRLYESVASWPGVMVIVSHDRGLLDLVDQVADLRDGAIRWYGGNLTAYGRKARPRCGPVWGERSALGSGYESAGDTDRRVIETIRAGWVNAEADGLGRRS